MRAARLLVVLALLAPGGARAESADAEQRAKLHYEAASGFYTLGNYTDAAREFAAGYQLTRKPEFLIDLGQCYRKLNDRARAAEMFRKYLVDAPASEVERRRQAQLVLDEIERELQAPPPAPVAPPQQLVAPPPHPAPALAVENPAPTAPRRTGFRRWWWILPVAAVIVGGAVALTAWLVTRPSVDCGSASFGCVSFPGAQ
jgi:hypothetical protein